MMIKGMDKSRPIQFEKIPVGQCFEFRGSIYLRLQSNNDCLDAVDLRDSTVVTFFAVEIVTPINAWVEVER